MSSYSEESSIDNFYIIRVRKDEDESLKMGRLDELEQILKVDDRARLEHVVRPIAAVVAFIYDESLAAELVSRGYELLPQKNLKMIE